jgi:hypothetical protein
LIVTTSSTVLISLSVTAVIMHLLSETAGWVVMYSGVVVEAVAGAIVSTLLVQVRVWSAGVAVLALLGSVIAALGMTVDWFDVFGFVSGIYSSCGIWALGTLMVGVAAMLHAIKLWKLDRQSMPHVGPGPIGLALKMVSLVLLFASFSMLVLVQVWAPFWVVDSYGVVWLLIMKHEGFGVYFIGAGVFGLLAWNGMYVYAFRRARCLAHGQFGVPRSG